MGLFSRERRWRTRPRRQQDPAEGARTSNRRLIVLRLVVVLLFSVLSLQLLRFQLLNGNHYQLESEDNRVRLVATAPSRGLIFDRNHVPLVQNVASYTAVIVPADLPKGHESDIYYQLSSVIGVPPDQIQQKVQDALGRADPFTPVPIKGNLDQRTVLTLAELRHTLPGVDISYDAVRQYSDSTIFSHVLGYVGKLTADQYSKYKDRGYQLNDVMGQAGVEQTYEDQLRGTPGQRQVEVDPTGREIRTLAEQPAKPGNNLVLTIDATLQQHVTDILQQQMQANQAQYPSQSAVAIMMDVHTGEILAYVSLPNYDVNLFSQGISDQDYQALVNAPGNPLKDHAIQDQYPPGSTFKVITGSAALETGVATKNTTLTVPPTRRYDFTGANGVVTSFYDWAALGTLDFLHGLAMSSDIYFYCLAGGCPQLPGGGIPFPGVGAANLAKFDKGFGLDAPTAIDLPGEVSGSFSDGSAPDWSFANTYFEGIGEGDNTATPIQMVRVAAAIANGGYLVQPHVVREIDDASGNVVQAPAADVVGRVPVSQQNLDLIRQGMIMAVEGGSAQTAWEPPLKIAGKTGTAEYGSDLANAPLGDSLTQNGVYNEHGWFISFAPYDNPQVALVVFQDRGNGAATAAPTAKKIWDYYFNDYKAGNPNPDASPTPSAGAGTAGH